MSHEIAHPKIFETWSKLGTGLNYEAFADVKEWAMPTTEPQPNKAEDLQVKLAAINRLIEEGEGLIRAQEQQVDKMRTSGLDCRHAQGLLEAYQASVRIALQEKRELEAKLANRDSS